MLHTLICAAGAQSRWQESGGRGLKQLIRVDGETLIDRTYRFAAERSYEVTTLVREPELPCWAAVNPAEPAHEDWMGEMGKFLDGRPHWPEQGEVVVLYGDVFYTEETIERIYGHEPTQPMIYGRAQARTAESFAIRFRVPDDVAEIERVASLCVERGLTDKGGPWRWFWLRHNPEATRYRKNVERVALKAIATEANGWVECGHDATDDFDRFGDFQAWRRRYGKGRA